MIDHLIFCGLLLVSMTCNLLQVYIGVRERNELYRLIKSESLTDFTSNDAHDLPKGISPLLDTMRRNREMREE